MVDLRSCMSKLSPTPSSHVCINNDPDEVTPYLSAECPKLLHPKTSFTAARLSSLVRVAACLHVFKHTKLCCLWGAVLQSCDDLIPAQIPLPADHPGSPWLLPSLAVMYVGRAQPVPADGKVGDWELELGLRDLFIWLQARTEDATRTIRNQSQPLAYLCLTHLSNTVLDAVIMSIASHRMTALCVPNDKEMKTCCCLEGDHVFFPPGVLICSFKHGIKKCKGISRYFRNSIKYRFSFQRSYE